MEPKEVQILTFNEHPYYAPAKDNLSLHEIVAYFNKQTNVGPIEKFFITDGNCISYNRRKREPFVVEITEV